LVSLDQQVGEDGDTALGDLLPSEAQPPEETAWDNERERIVHRAISQLPDTERTVLTLRFGTGREEPQTLTAIGKRLGFSAERASQLEQRALKKLAESPELGALRGRAHDAIDEAPSLGLAGVVLAAQKPDLARSLLPHHPRQVAGAEAGVERAHPRAGLAEAGVLGGDGQIADHVQHVPAAD